MIIETQLDGNSEEGLERGKMEYGNAKTILTSKCGLAHDWAWGHVKYSRPAAAVSGEARMRIFLGKEGRKKTIGN